MSKLLPKRLPEPAVLWMLPREGHLRPLALTDKESQQRIPVAEQDAFAQEPCFRGGEIERSALRKAARCPRQARIPVRGRNAAHRVAVIVDQCSACGIEPVERLVVLRLRAPEPAEAPGEKT